MDIYGIDKDYPLSLVTSMYSGKIGEWKLVTVQICPYQYNPVTGILSMIELGDLEVVYQKTDVKDYIVGAKRWRDLASESLNFDAMSATYSPTSSVAEASASSGAKSSGSGIASYVIFTTSDIQSNSSYLLYFIAHKQNRGFSVRVVTEGSSQDATHYLSGSTCDQRSNNMRAWLVANHVSLGVEYVLFLGNPHPTEWNTNNSVPMKMCYPRNGYDCPTDMYYAELSGNWDNDQDNIYGEFNGDYGSGGIDKYCEVAVGRIPVYDTGATQIGYLDSILQKTINYERSTDRAWRKNFLGSAGFFKDYYGSYSDRARMIETFKDNVCLPNDWGHTRLYQQGSIYSGAYSSFSCDYELRGEAYGSQVNHHSYHWQNNDYGISMWWDHGSSVHTTVGDNNASDGTRFQNWMSSNLDDAHPSFLFPAACNNGYPEEINNLCVSVLRNGGIGSLSPSRVTWRKSVDWQTSFFTQYSDNASYNYNVAERMVTNHKSLGEAANWVHANGGLGMSYGHSFMNHLDFNIYGDPSVGLYTSVPIPMPISGDYDGDLSDDLAEFHSVSGNWYIRKLDGTILGNAINWGFPGCVPVSGDYDGDDVDDLAVFDDTTGIWYIRKLDGTILGNGINWGFPGCVAVAGDYDGDSTNDLAVFDQNTGRWFIRSLDGTQIAWNVNWGWPGVDPVAGDFNGDSTNDLAIFDQATGRWFIRSVDGTQLGWDINWGWPGVQPVSGDFDGDGADDLAIFDEATGRWFIRSLDGTTIAWSVNWGFSGCVPVSGDYDGDGTDDEDDLAVFDDATGMWYIRKLNGQVLYP